MNKNGVEIDVFFLFLFLFSCFVLFCMFLSYFSQECITQLSNLGVGKNYFFIYFFFFNLSSGAGVVKFHVQQCKIHI